MQKPKLSEHKKVGDTLETPWLSGDIGKIWNLSSWSRDSLPEYLWIALIFDKYGRDRGLLIFSKILEECKYYKLYSSKISLITKMAEERQKKFYEIIDRYAGRDVLSPLTIIVDAESCPLFYSHYVNPSITITEKVETITRVIKSNMRLHENESTDVCYIALWFVVIEGKLSLGPSVSVIGDALTEYHKYNHADEVMRMYRPSIRSTFQAVSQIDRNLEFCEKCWKKLADITPCNPLILQYEKKGEDFMEYYADAKKVIEFIQATNEDKKLDKRYEVCMGIVMYIFKLYCEIVDNNLLCQISGRIIFRTMVENYFNLKYLLLKEQDEPRIYEMFQEYGRGKYKLVMSKLREGKFQVEECSHMSKTIMEAYVNEDKDENFLNISLNFFDKQNLRNKVQYMDEEELYEIYYEYDTNYVHGFWGAIREASMLICDNPAHLYHTVPDYSNEQHLYTVEDDCSMLMRKVFKLLSNIVELPDFYLQKYRE